MKGISSPPFSLKPSGGMYLGTRQEGIPASTWTIVLLDEICDLGVSDGIESVGNNRIIPVKIGLYLVFGQVSFTDIVADRNYYAGLGLNGAMVKQRECQTGGSVQDDSFGIFSLVPIALPTDYIQLMCNQDTAGTNPDVHNGESKTYLHVQRFR